MTRTLIGAMGLALAAVSVCAAQVTTTTTTSSTTTTTLAGTCDPHDTTLTGLTCRLDAFLAVVQNTNGLGRLQKSMVNSLQKARANIGKAQAFCTTNDGKKAGKQVQLGARHVTSALHTLDSNNGRKLPLSATDRSALHTTGGALQTDLKVVRKSIHCP